MAGRRKIPSSLKKRQIGISVTKHVAEEYRDLSIAGRKAVQTAVAKALRSAITRQRQIDRAEQESMKQAQYKKSIDRLKKKIDSLGG